MNDNLKKLATIGFIAKGAVYATVGGLALASALNMGGEKAGLFDVVEFLEKQPFGKVILAVLGLGLLCLSFWRFVQGIRDPEDIGSDLNGWFTRIGLLTAGFFFLGLGGFALYEIFWNVPIKQGGGSPRELGDWGKYVFYIIGASLTGKAFYQFFMAYEGGYTKLFYISPSALDAKRAFVKNTGRVGLIARGIITGVVAYFFLNAGYRWSLRGSEKVRGTEEAFSFIQNNAAGSWLLGLVAIGLISYGIHMFAMARYRKFDG
ncbi:DUF1206 domain-containing protein [Pricia sp. S334]|uniref:DUF1206 domain-containing protein n=1 Tax=Pricia mediterranea TaxID=3076079 RepID=A0ABU3LBC2_9FLAO|nr:DUF1206 domain-containing protein [Pricia sp. S334]MDT7830581.1 DUF1206 domain-containing protein [Pricia sp. S334]